MFKLTKQSFSVFVIKALALLIFGLMFLQPANTEFALTRNTQAASVSLQGDLRPTGARRSLYPHEWGVDHVAGLAYATTLGQFFILDKARHQQTTIVAITPHEALMDRAVVDFAIGEALNVAYDEGGRRLLLLNQQATEVAQVKLNEQNRLEPTTLQSASLAHLRLGKIQGMAVDNSGQTLFLLDQKAHQVVKISLTAAFDFMNAPVSYLDLAGIGAAKIRGLALHPITQHLFIGTPTEQVLHELTQNGEVVNSYTLDGFATTDLQSFVFAPSADLTDAPETFHLFLADSQLPDTAAATVDLAEAAHRLYLPFITAQQDETATVVQDVDETLEAAKQPAKQRLGEIVEVALDGSDQLVTAAAGPPIILNLVRRVNTAAFSPSSPDPSGLAFIPPLNRLLISDGEVDEIPALFTGANLFETTTGGLLSRTGTTLAYSIEPTGVAFNPTNGHLFIVDDDRREVYEIVAGADNAYGTSDDGVTSFDTAIFNSLDPEGVTYDAASATLYIVDGINAEVYRVTPGANGRFDGIAAVGGDDVVSNFDVQGIGVFDPEGIYYDAVSGHLFLIGNNRTRLYEITTAGALWQLYDTTVANVIKGADLTLAPASNNSAVRNFYVVDRGIDNDADPTENDGKLYELALPSSNPTPTPINTPLPPTPTNTPLPLTPTNTPLPPTPTNTPSPLLCSGGAFYQDQFSTTSYTNNNGSLNWTTGWTESVDNNSPSNGRIRISNGELRLSDSPDSGQQPTIRRQANLVGAVTATFTFTHRTPNTVDSTDSVSIQISNNGGATWTTLQTLSGRTTGSKSYNISAFIASNSMVRFVVSANYNISDEYFAVDNVQITCN